MAKTLTAALLGTQKSEALDWAVFGIGALALSVAIAGTILTHTSDYAAHDAEAESVVVTG